MNDIQNTSTLELLIRDADTVYSAKELAERLGKKKQLRVKIGLDPTAPDLTLGHAVVLRKLRQFQDCGHKAVLIIGDYTAMIGDPTGRTKSRPILTEDEVDANAKTYLEQAGKIIDMDESKLEVRRNSEWLKPLQLKDILALMAQMTVARMLERDTFAKRQAEGKEIYMHELLYPIMQAYDSVMIESDVELGGTDQTFNNLCGRDYQRNVGQQPQIVLVMPILVGTDGVQKMSKSLGNYIGIADSPTDMFGKTMRIPDELMSNYFELLTDMPEDEVSVLVDVSQCNPRDSKERLAKEIIRQYHSADAADKAAEEFRRVHSGGSQGLPDDIEEWQVPAELLSGDGATPVDLLVSCGFEKSRGEARRIVGERGIRLNGEVVEEATKPIEINNGDILQRGKRRFIRLVIS